MIFSFQRKKIFKKSIANFYPKNRQSICIICSQFNIPYSDIFIRYLFHSDDKLGHLLLYLNLVHLISTISWNGLKNKELGFWRRLISTIMARLKATGQVFTIFIMSKTELSYRKEIPILIIKLQIKNIKDWSKLDGSIDRYCGCGSFIAI